jgi:hypothetical protein
MVPRIFPAVDGSARTLTWVDVAPSTGTEAEVGWGVASGCEVSEGAGVCVTGGVEVTDNAVPVEIVPSRI